DAARLRLPRGACGRLPGAVRRLRPGGLALPRVREPDPRGPPGPALDVLLPGMSTLSATGAWPIATRSLERSLTDYRQWRDATTAALSAYRRWALVARLLDEQAAARLAHLERRLASDRLTIAFVAEYSRGKSELINAIFFGDAGQRLLPSGPGHTTLCATEIAWDPARPPSLRLLPIQTREGQKALREHIQETEGWTVVEIDPARPESVAQACEAITESIEVDAGHAASLG